jgi:hypothetical protein
MHILEGTQTNLTVRTTLAWVRTYIADLIVLVLGTGLTLRFWYIIFEVHDRRFMAIISVLAVCAIAKRIVMSCRQGQRPWLFVSERRFDLIAALAIGTAPWPITLPLNAAAPFWSIWQASPLQGWIRPAAALVLIAVNGRRLLSSRP